MRIATDNDKINKGIEIALKDIELNIKNYKSGLLDKEKPVLLAGGDYDRPWTRDASINTYNYLSYSEADIARNTLISVLEEDDGPRIGGQYWDCVIWALGAEQYILMNTDDEFTETAVKAVSNTLNKLEIDEYSPEYGLFRGAAVYGDGVSAYPDVYGISGDRGCILDWPKQNPERAALNGYGIPMHTLSTNCAYYNAYMMLYRLAGDEKALGKAENLKRNINKYFYDDGLKYIVGKFGDYSEQEGMGVSLGLMFGVLPDGLVKSIKSTGQGIACVYPGYERYMQGDDIGRHSGTIWPFINCFYANEAIKRGNVETFSTEFNGLLDKAVRDGQFYEIFHPVTGMPYGGIQEGSKTSRFYMLKSCEHQAWSATGFISMLVYGAAGLEAGNDCLRINPCLPENINEITIEGLKYRDASLDIYIAAGGKYPNNAVVTADAVGNKKIEISVKR